MSSQGPSSRGNNVTNGGEQIDTNNPSEDPRVVLDTLVLAENAVLAEHALRYSVNLDGFVSKDNVSCARGGYAMVWSGVLRLRDAMTAGKEISRNRFFGNGDTVKVAIKIGRGNMPGDTKIIKNFLREVHSWSKLDHPNVLPLIGFTTDFDWTVSIVSPWMEKGNARQFVRNNLVDPRPVIEGIANGLCYLHNCIYGPLYHGDLNGHNVLISDSDEALLTDFGLSCLANSSFSLSTPMKSGGKLPWMAPEMLNDSGNGGDGDDSDDGVNCEATAAGDVWSFAMTALELFTRENPFHPVRRAVGITTRILKGPPDRPSPKNTCYRFTDEWWNICTKCWHTEPPLRPTMTDVANKIQRIMALSHTSTLNGARQWFNKP